jgi:uncharacterized protein YabN with tetrapyrrole methylase and pyrophosphatase domain
LHFTSLEQGKWLEEAECVAWPVEHVRLAGRVDEQQLHEAQSAFENSEAMRVKKTHALVSELEDVFSRVLDKSSTGDDDGVMPPLSLEEVYTSYSFEKLEHARQSILAMQEEQACFDAQRLRKLWRSLRMFEMERRSMASGAL